MLYRNITLSANITEVESVETVEASLWLPVWFISHCVITVILILSRFVRITIIMSFFYLFFKISLLFNIYILFQHRWCGALFCSVLYRRIPALQFRQRPQAAAAS